MFWARPSTKATLRVLIGDGRRWQNVSMRSQWVARVVWVVISVVSSVGTAFLVTWLTTSWSWGSASALVFLVIATCVSQVYLVKPNTDSVVPVPGAGSRSAGRDYIENTGDGDVTIYNRN